MQRLIMLVLMLALVGCSSSKQTLPPLPPAPAPAPAPVPTPPKPPDTSTLPPVPDSGMLLCVQDAHDDGSAAGPWYCTDQDGKPLLAKAPLGGATMKCLLEHELAHAAGWPDYHPGAIYTRRDCGKQLNGEPFPMPPPGRYKLKKGQKVIIHHSLATSPCFGAHQACTLIGANPSHIWLPQ